MPFEIGSVLIIVFGEFIHWRKKVFGWELGALRFLPISITNQCCEVVGKSFELSLLLFPCLRNHGTNMFPDYFTETL